MSWGAEEVLLAARETWLRPGAVSENLQGDAVNVEGEHLVLAFSWKRHPRQFQIRLPLADLQHGRWTGMETESPQDWVNEAFGWLMEELDTGATHWAVRHERDGLIELDLAAGPPSRSAYYVSDATTRTAPWLQEHGLDVSAAVDAAAGGRLRAWMYMYADNANGEPVVAHVALVEGQDPNGAAVLALQAVVDVPLNDVTRLVHHALCSAAESGARRITCDFDHLALRAAGMQPDAAGGLHLDALQPWPLPFALRARSGSPAAP